MTRTDVATAHIITLVDEYEATALRLGELVRDNASVEDRFPLYRELIDLAHQLAALLHERGDHYRRRTESWREGLDRLRRYT
jgi:hypothetical protein